MKRANLGDILIEMGALDDLQLQSALAHQRQWGMPLGKAVVEKRFCSSGQVLAALSRQAGLPVIDLDQEQLDPRLARLVTMKVAQQHHLVPVRLQGPRNEELVVAIAAPASLASLDAVRAVSRKSRIIGLLASDGAIDRAIARLYVQPIPVASRDPLVTQPLRFDEIERALRLDRVQRPPPVEVLVYGWPDPAGQRLVAALESHGILARLAGALQVQTAAPEDIVVAPIPSMEALVRVAEPGRARLIVAGKNPDTDLARAHRLGARSFLLAPVDFELLLRAIRRCEETTPHVPLEASVA